MTHQLLLLSPLLLLLPTHPASCQPTPQPSPSQASPKPSSILQQGGSRREQRFKGLRNLLDSMDLTQEDLSIRSLLQRMVRMRMVQLRRAGSQGAKVTMKIKKKDIIKMIRSITETRRMRKMIKKINYGLSFINRIQ